MKIEQIVLRQITMPLVHFFETSFGRTYERHMVLVEVRAGGVSGWGEVTCGENPFYNEEWTDSAWSIVRDFAGPRVLNYEFATASDVGQRTEHIRGHNMARGGLEAAVWDLEARLKNEPLWKLIGGGARKEIPCGVSIGIQDTVDQLLGKIETEVNAGYQRIKMKIKPGWDVEVVREVRTRFPQIKRAEITIRKPNAPVRGVLDALKLAAKDFGMEPDSMLSKGQLFVHGTTRVTCESSCKRASSACESAAGSAAMVLLGPGFASDDSDGCAWSAARSTTAAKRSGPGCKLASVPRETNT